VPVKRTGLTSLRHVLGSWTLLTFDDVELYRVTLCKGLEARAGDRAVVNKQSFCPLSGVMNPKPFASLNHFTLPVVRIPYSWKIVSWGAETRPTLDNLIRGSLKPRIGLEPMAKTFTPTLARLGGKIARTG